MGKDFGISYKVLDEDPYENVFDENDSSILAMRTVKWGNGEPRLELRKWRIDPSGGKDIPNKGFSFLSENGPHNLVHTLIKNGYGDKKENTNLISKRSDFNWSILEEPKEENKGFTKDEFMKLLIPKEDD